MLKQYNTYHKMYLKNFRTIIQQLVKLFTQAKTKNIKEQEQKKKTKNKYCMLLQKICIKNGNYSIRYTLLYTCLQQCIYTHAYIKQYNVVHIE